MVAGVVASAAADDVAGLGVADVGRRPPFAFDNALVAASLAVTVAFRGRASGGGGEQEGDGVTTDSGRVTTLVDTCGAGKANRE